MADTSMVSAFIIIRNKESNRVTKVGCGFWEGDKRKLLWISRCRLRFHTEVHRVRGASVPGPRDGTGRCRNRRSQPRPERPRRPVSSQIDARVRYATEPTLQGLGVLPRQHLARIPVHNDHQGHKTLGHGKDRPGARRQGHGCDASDTVPPSPSAASSVVEPVTATLEFPCQTATPVERRFQVYFVHPPHPSRFLLRPRLRTVVRRRPPHPFTNRFFHSWFWFGCTSNGCANAAECSRRVISHPFSPENAPVKDFTYHA